MRRMMILAAAVSLVLVACGGDDAPSADGEQDPAEEAPATIEAADSDLGSILVDADGNTLYMFVPDEGGDPTCYEECAANWPPLEATGDPTVGPELDGSLLNTVERTDGATQVTYNDLPLYLFSGDEAAGDTNGQGLDDVWWVVSPEGEPVMD